MKLWFLTIGAPPYSEAPDQLQWAQVPDTTTTRWDIALPVGALAGLIAWLGFARAPAFIDPWWYALGIFAGVLVVHESVHYAVLPRTGRKTFGIWPAAGVAYVGFRGSMSRWRSALAFMAPVLVLTVVPMVVNVFVTLPDWVRFAAIWNAVTASFDIQKTVALFVQSRKNDEIVWAHHALWARK